MSHQGASRQTVAIQHVTIRSSRPVDRVRTKLEGLLPRIDDGIFTLLRYGEVECALQELEAAAPLLIFGFRDHGALLAVAGLKRRRQSAHRVADDPPSDLRRPLRAIRVLLREDGEAEAAFEYDRPASFFGQFGDVAVDRVAQQLDRELQAALEDAAS